MRKIIFTIALACSILCAPSVHAAVNYWRPSAAPPGSAGGATPAGTWDTGTTANWDTAALGTGSHVTWAANDSAVFSAAGDATGSFTVTIPASTTVSCAALTVEEGTILQGVGTLSFGGVNGVFTINSGATWNCSGAGSGFIAGTAGITKSGPGTLFLGGSELYSGAAWNAVPHHQRGHR
jgi:fibronectin-binding autotransporter adhesin